MNGSRNHKLAIRNLKTSDYSDISQIMDKIYAGMGGAWKPDEYETLLSLFPEGQICIEDKGTVVAAAMALIVDSNSLERNHSYEDVISKGRFEKHDPEGDYLYGIDVFVRKDYRSMRLGRRLYDARKELCEKINLKGIIVGGRLPGYAKYHQEITPKQYIEKVRNKEIVDSVLTFQLSNDFHTKRVLKITFRKIANPVATPCCWNGTTYFTSPKRKSSGAANPMSASAWCNGRCEGSSLLTT